VGGTNLQTAATPTANDVTYAGENANFDPRLPSKFSNGNFTFEIGNNTWGSGGGFSRIFAKPSYQSLVNTGSNQFRAVPDVALMMGGCPTDANLAVQNCRDLPRGGAIIWIGGKPRVLIGTSSAAPEMAGVLARAVSLFKSRQGNVNPIIYTMAARQTAQGGVNAPAAFQYFHRNITGNNNGFTVKPGQEYSEVLGVGTVNVLTFLQAQGLAPAGAPNTASNP
jgi:subtilase family serine protease